MNDDLDLYEEPHEGWALQELTLPLGWYENIAGGTAHGFPISGDATATHEKGQQK